MKVNFEQVEAFVSALAETVRGKGFTSIYAPARGGLVFGVWLSHKLNLPLAQSPVGKCLIVDDIADSGQTLKKFAGKFFIATMFYQPDCSFEPDFWMFEKGEEWVVYPWEK